MGSGAGTVRDRDHRWIVFDQQKIHSRGIRIPQGDDFLLTTPLLAQRIDIGQTSKIGDLKDGGWLRR